jgi:two-component system NtrC family sensor kinase
MRLKTKVLLGIASLSLTIAGTFAYGAWTFHALSGRMQTVNDLYVPSSKALNQLESSFFLLESDLDKSLSEGVLRPRDTLESVIKSRLEYLGRLARDENLRDPALAKATEDLDKSYRACAEILQEVYQDWQDHGAYEASLSAARSDFRVKLKTLMNSVDQEMRGVSTEVQSGMARLSFVLTAVLAFCCAMAIALSYWLSRAVSPLETLASVMRSISQVGLDEKVIRRLVEIPTGSDEVGTLSRETQKMAASLLDKNKALTDQKINLERAHFEMATQNDELKNTQAKLLHSEKLGLVGRMAAQMAHEIRNPLNALNLHAELLEDQLKGDTKRLASLEPVRKEINRLIDVTESYLDLSRGPRLKKTFVQLNTIAEEIHDLYEPLLKEKGIYFTCDLANLPPLAVDRAQFAQLIGNLVKNASEAFDGSTRKAKYVRLITNFEPEKGQVTVTVMDNGEGIAIDQQKNIFAPFFTSKAQGTGLGLTFSRQVVEAHGGEIHFDSAPKQGTKFTLSLPTGGMGGAEEGPWKTAELRS